MASRSGLRIMSDSLMAFQPSIDEPSNIRPSSSSPSVRTPATMVRCCHLPFGSVKRRSTHWISSSLMRFRTSLALLIRDPSFSDFFRRSGLPEVARNCDGSSTPRPVIDLQRSDRRVVPLARTDAQRAFDRDNEDLAVADAPGLRGLGDRLDHALGQGVAHDDLELHLGQEVDDIFGTAIKLGVALLPAEALGLGDGDAGYADFVKRLLHLVELERLDDSLDLFHVCQTPARRPGESARALLPGARRSGCPIALAIPISRIVPRRVVLTRPSLSPRKARN